TLDVCLAVGAVAALRAIDRAGQQPDLLVVADRAGRRAGELGDLADPQRLRCYRAHAAACTSVAAGRSSSASTVTCLGLAAATNGPSTEIAASVHRAGCMLEMNGSSCAVEMWLARPENTLNRTFLGTEEVTTASTNAIEITAPVFCTSTRAPAAMPRRWA